MTDILFVVEAKDGSNAAKTLRFSVGGYIDSSNNYYDPRISGPALINVSPNDGDLLGIFNSSSIGNIVLVNTDGGLNYLADYAVDGRAATISIFDGTSVIDRFSGTVSSAPVIGETVTFTLKALQEALNKDHPMDVYAGTNSLPAGIEGTANTIKGNVKPKVYGDCRNITPVVVNTSLLIDQASSLSNCRITRVFDDGARLTNYQTSGAHTAGATSIAVTTDPGFGDLPSGAEIVFDNHNTIYTITSPLYAGNIAITPGIDVNVPDSTPFDIINFYTGSAATATEIGYFDYRVNGDHTQGDTTIAIDSGAGTISTGDKIIFGSHMVLYEVSVGVAAPGTITLSDELQSDLEDGDVVHVISANSPTLWGSYQGYFRLNATSAGAVTCDAISIDGSDEVHLAGDVFNLIAVEAGLTVDATSITNLNAAGTIGLYVDQQVTTVELLNRIVHSVAGYYYFSNDTVYMGLFSAPAVSADWTINDYQIDSITLLQSGLGRNRLPIHTIRCKYDRIETVQTSLAGRVKNSQRQRLKTQYREIKRATSGVKTRHPLSQVLKIESLLRSSADVEAMLDRLEPITSVRRDVVDLVLPYSQAPSYQIGSTGNIITPRLDYDSGRLMMLIGYEINDTDHTVTLRLYG